MADPGKPTPAEALFDELWPVRQPPPGFAERVVTASLIAPVVPSPSPSPSSGRRWPLAGIAALAAAAVVLLVSLLNGGSSRDGGRSSPLTPGHLRAQERRTVEVGGRAVAVVEPGGEIAWSARDGRLRVDQPQGVVFYRVNPGGAFQVVTPAGEIEVRGTCFRVTAGAAPGQPSGALATTAWVEVMEGAIILRNGHGAIPLSAGERGRVALGSPPVRAMEAPEPDRRASSAVASAPLANAAAERVSPSGVRGPARGDDGSPPGEARRGKYFDFTPEERKVLARRCNFRWALPRHLTHFAAPEFKDVSLGPGQRESIARLLEEHRDEFMQQLRGIYLEVVGDRQAVQTLSALSLYQEVDAKSPRAEGVEARRLILREWQGAVAPPPQLGSRPAVERLWRVLVGAQDELVRRLERVVAPADARRIGEELLDVRISGIEPGCPSGN